MTEGYRVPKHRIPAEVVLAGQPPREIELFLAERAERHTGRERPSDLLASGEPFFPVRTDATGHELLRRSAVLVLTVRAEDELDPAPPEPEGLAEAGAPAEDAERREVFLQMEDGTEVRGSVTYLGPAGSRRLQDFLNRADAFVRVRDGDLIRLVNTSRIVRAVPS